MLLAVQSAEIAAPYLTMAYSLVGLRRTRRFEAARVRRLRVASGAHLEAWAGIGNDGLHRFGAIRYEASGEPIYAGYCYCADCNHRCAQQ